MRKMSYGAAQWRPDKGLQRQNVLQFFLLTVAGAA